MWFKFAERLLIKEAFNIRQLSDVYLLSLIQNSNWSYHLQDEEFKQKVVNFFEKLRKEYIKTGVESLRDELTNYKLRQFIRFNDSIRKDEMLPLEIQQLTNYKNVMNRLNIQIPDGTQLMQLCSDAAAIFNEGDNWETYFGGKPWAEIATQLGKFGTINFDGAYADGRQLANEIQKFFIVFDRFNDLSHNSGLALNKMIDRDDINDITSFLDYKAEMTPREIMYMGSKDPDYEKAIVREGLISHQKPLELKPRYIRRTNQRGELNSIDIDPKTGERRERPSVIAPYGRMVQYHNNGQLYKEEHYKPGTRQRHRDDGPAVYTRRGDDERREWFQNGQKHRDDGPAAIYKAPHSIEEDYYSRGEKKKSVVKELDYNGEVSRIITSKYQGHNINCDNGPAIITTDAKGNILHEEYRINGRRLNPNGPSSIDYQDKICTFTMMKPRYDSYYPIEIGSWRPSDGLEAYHGLLQEIGIPEEKAMGMQPPFQPVDPDNYDEDNLL